MDFLALIALTVIGSSIANVATTPRNSSVNDNK